jgi:hypothetical protein
MVLLFLGRYRLRPSSRSGSKISSRHPINPEIPAQVADSRAFFEPILVGVSHGPKQRENHRSTRWFNRTRQRSGNLWEDAFKSVIVED